jgi:hypothetical protein
MPLFFDFLRSLEYNQPKNTFIYWKRKKAYISLTGLINRKERGILDWNFVPIAVHVLNQKKQAPVTPLFFVAQNAILQSNLQI